MKVLVADDERNIRSSIISILELEKITSFAAENGLSAKRLLENEVFDAAIIDLRMPGLDGLALLEWIQKQGPAIPVIIISAYGDVKDAVQAMKLGAEDYLVKPFDPEELIIRLKKILERRWLREEYEAGRIAYDKDSELIGQSKYIIEIKKLVKKISLTNSTILITGESGTGKEVIARYIHKLSYGPDKPFIAINIGAIPENLLESELFGFEKGAFTGAAMRKLGMFELATSGTLLLDEIGDMPLHLQVKLLRAIQENKIQRLGSTQAIPVNARIITATNRDLKEMAAKGMFRQDLFYRLNIIHIHLPPLRERREDIPLLTGYLINKLNKKLDKPECHIEPDALQALQAYHFPGNIRELENIIERALILCDNEKITLTDLGMEPLQNSLKAVPKGTLKEIEKWAINQALIRWEGNRTKVAGELGISRKTLQNKIKEYGLDCY
jgi:two-component system response regulator AtoC